MSPRFHRQEPLALLWTLAKWGVLGAWVGLLSGVASALFLHALGWATTYRESHPYLLFGLPLAGAAIGFLYHRFGKSVEGGNNLLLERIHEPDAPIPFRMAPLILIGTLVTHLFGGSAGREGTAVQMGGALASLATGPLRLSPREHQRVIQSGISGGFGSVFGTPLAGTIFGLEVLRVGKLTYEGLIPCFVAALVGDAVCRALGVQHHAYSAGLALPASTPLLWLLVTIAGGLFGGASVLFVELTHALQRRAKRHLTHAWLRPLVGGSLVIVLTYLVGTREYLGLSLPLIERSFTPGGVVLWAFALKILFTAVTLATGFKGGEVTPLFCIGATLGAAFAKLTGQPVAYFAALGFVAVFAGAANTPLACIVLGIELFGAPMALPLAAACIVSYTLSGHRGIYLSQRVDTPKSHELPIAPNSVLRELRVTEEQASAERA